MANGPRAVLTWREKIERGAREADALAREAHSEITAERWYGMADGMRLALTMAPPPSRVERENAARRLRCEANGGHQPADGDPTWCPKCASELEPSAG
jgi:hypothetical protein